MAKSGTTWQPGQSGNPNGRPKKERALTAILERAGGHTTDVGGKRVSGRQLIARMLWEAVTTGKVTFPNKHFLAIDDVDDWAGIVKFIYQHIDGPPKSKIEVDAPQLEPLSEVLKRAIAQVYEDDEIPRARRDD
jgi:hypothetical protein